MKRKAKLDTYEQAIENQAESLVPVSMRDKQRIDAILEKARKNISISLRINNYDLEKLKSKAKTNGLPYQTMITTILHKYINGDFFDKNEVLKTFKLMKLAT